jgi:hypothetical protein
METLLDINTMARKARCSTQTIRRAVWSLVLPATQPAQKILVTEEAFHAWLRAGRPTCARALAPYRPKPKSAAAAGGAA